MQRSYSSIMTYHKKGRPNLNGLLLKTMYSLLREAQGI
jgi:hypothetical protein